MYSVVEYAHREHRAERVAVVWSAALPTITLQSPSVGIALQRMKPAFQYCKNGFLA